MDLVRAHEFRVASAVSGQILQTNDEITFVELHIWIWYQCTLTHA